MPESVEETSVSIGEIESSRDQDSRALVRLDRLLVKCGLADSTTDATRKLKQGSVRVENEMTTDPRLILVIPDAGQPIRLSLIHI